MTKLFQLMQVPTVMRTHCMKKSIVLKQLNATNSLFLIHMEMAYVVQKVMDTTRFYMKANFYWKAEVLAVVNLQTYLAMDALLNRLYLHQHHH
jgi:hypothetical protein